MIYPTDAIPEECLFKPSFSYAPILIMHKSHPLANKNTITLKDMSRHDLVRIDPQLITLPFFEEAVEKYGIGSNISFENGNWEMLKHFVRAKIGIAMVSTICIDESDTDIVTKSMKKFFPTMVYGIMVKKGHYLNETVKDLITFLDDEFLENNEIQNP